MIMIFGYKINERSFSVIYYWVWIEEIWYMVFKFVKSIYDCLYWEFFF